MKRVHDYILGTMKADKESRAKLKKQVDPFNTQEVDNVNVESQLEYGEDERVTIKLHLRGTQKTGVQD